MRMDLGQQISLAMGIMPNTKEFAMVMRGIEIAKQHSMGRKAKIISYPSGSRNYDLTEKGQVTIDFTQGKVVNIQAGAKTNDNLNGTLDKCRSLLLFVNDADAIISFDGIALTNDHDLWHLFEDIDVTTLSIQFPSGTGITPDQFNYAFVASDKPFMSYKNNLFVAHDFVLVAGYVTTASKVTNILKHVAGYNYAIFTFKNTTATSAEITVEYSPDGTNWYPQSGYNPLTLAGNSTDTLTVTTLAHFYRVQSKNGAGSTTIDVAIQLVR